MGARDLIPGSQSKQRASVWGTKQAMHKGQELFPSFVYIINYLEKFLFVCLFFQASIITESFLGIIKLMFKLVFFLKY